MNDDVLTGEVKSPVNGKCSSFSAIARPNKASLQSRSEVYMGIPEWKEIAIPEGFGPYRLLYNPPSETVIVELRSILRTRPNSF